MAPTPKRRRGRKGALTEVNANIPRLRPSTTNQPVKKVATKRRLTTADLDDVALKKRSYQSHHSLLTDIQVSSSTENYEGFRLPMGNLEKNGKLGVFRNAEEHSPGNLHLAMLRSAITDAQ